MLSLFLPKINKLTFSLKMTLPFLVPCRFSPQAPGILLAMLVALRALFYLDASSYILVHTDPRFNYVKATSNPQGRSMCPLLHCYFLGFFFVLPEAALRVSKANIKETRSTKQKNPQNSRKYNFISFRKVNFY